MEKMSSLTVDGLMLYAGGGLLSESELTAERNEILAKMSTITRHLTR